jgi:KUP system potassium uptake protein
MRVLHTSKDMAGQIYLPFINWALALACIGLVLIFRASAALGAAFGLAVSGTMVLTTLIFEVVLIRRWGWSKPKSHLFTGLLLCVELPFLAATLLKFFHGGYIPICIGAVLFLLMFVWSRGRSLLREHYARQLPAIEVLPRRLQELNAARVPGVGIYLTADPTRMPKVMESQLSHLRCVFETIVLVSVSTASVPYVDESESFQFETIMDGQVHRLYLRYGFMEVPDIPASLARLRKLAGMEKAPVRTFLLGKDSFMSTNFGHMPAWQESIFAFLSRNSLDATQDFKLPIDEVLEINNRLDL